jgi:hypothetical protein
MLSDNGRPYGENRKPTIYKPGHSVIYDADLKRYVDEKFDDGSYYGGEPNNTVLALVKEYPEEVADILVDYALDYPQLLQEIMTRKA